jgi:hypothetical protein
MHKTQARMLRKKTQQMKAARLVPARNPSWSFSIRIRKMMVMMMVMMVMMMVMVMMVI